MAPTPPISTGTYPNVRIVSPLADALLEATTMDDTPKAFRTTNYWQAIYLVAKGHEMLAYEPDHLDRSGKTIVRWIFSPEATADAKAYEAGADTVSIGGMRRALQAVKRAIADLNRAEKQDGQQGADAPTDNAPLTHPGATWSYTAVRPLYSHGAPKGV